MKEMKQDSSTIAWNAMGDEWFELAQTGEARSLSDDREGLIAFVSWRTRMCRAVL